MLEYLYYIEILGFTAKRGLVMANKYNFDQIIDRKMPYHA